MEVKRKIGFFKRFKMSIFELENYIEFTAEKCTKAILFIIKTTALFTLILVALNIGYIYVRYGSPLNYANEIVPEFKYENSTFVIENEKNDYQKAVASAMKQVEPTYKNLMQEDNFSKADIMNYVQNNQNQIVIMLSIFTFFTEFLDILFLWFMFALLTSLVGLIVLRFSRIKMKYSKLFALSVYASTLSITLTLVYTVLNSFFGIYIDLFDYLSMLIAYIYITAVIYMIKSDLIKQQMELIRITAVKTQSNEDEENENDTQDKKEDEKKKENEDEKREKDEEEPSDEPDGSEI